MTNTTLIRTALIVAFIVAFGFVATGRAPANGAKESVVQLVASDATSRFIPLGLGKSVVIDLPRDIKDVLVADPKIANAVVRSTRRAYIIGVKEGQTNVYFFDGEGRQMGGLDIAVTRDLNGIRAALKHALPNSDIHVEGLGTGVVLSGSVATPADAQAAFDIASRLVEDGRKVVNGVAIRGRDQVMLKVTVAEVQRDIIKQLGVNLDGNFGSSAVIDWRTINDFTAFGEPLSASRFIGTWKTASATLRAMERAGVVRTLAEPTLTAISGETANFLAGGEFPLRAGVSCSGVGIEQVCIQQVQFKKFGVSLSFTPVVVAEGRISVRVMTEVSELSLENALRASDGSVIPSIKTRRADTTVEVPSGGSLGMAGMIQEQTKQHINGVPGMLNIPILGTLFKSRDYVNRQSELMILVTPYVVRAVAQKDLSRPDDGFADASDPQSVLLGRFNRIYGVPAKTVARRPYHGKYGFIID